MNIIVSSKSYRNILTVKRIFLGIVFTFVIMGFQQTAFAQFGAIAAIDEPATGEAINSSKNARATNNPFSKQSSSTASKNTSKSSKSKNLKSNTASKTVSPKPRSTSRGNTQADSGFVLGDKYTFLNNEIAVPVRPVYTIKAKQAGASGLVQVEILIDENGNVIQARARTGNALLHPEAEKAAWETKFNKPSIYGKPAKAAGFIVFRFGKAEVEDDEN